MQMVCARYAVGTAICDDNPFFQISSKCRKLAVPFGIWEWGFWNVAVSEIRIPKSQIDMGATGFDRGLYRSLDARRAFCR